MGTEPRHASAVEYILQDPAVAVADANTASFIVPFDGFIENIHAEVRVAGITGAMIADLNKNGTTIFAASEKITFGAAVAPSDYSLLTAGAEQVAKGDMISLDIDSIHSGTAAELLAVHVRLNRRNQGVTTNLTPANLR